MSSRSFDQRRPGHLEPRGRSVVISCWAAVVLLSLGSWAGCIVDRPLHVALKDDVDRPPRSVVVFFVDGMDRARFRQLLAEGALPHIDQRFVRGGVRVEDAVSSLPSVTYPNCSSLLTGRFPGHHDILGNFWFDRATLEAYDYVALATYLDVNRHLRAATLYDLLRDRFTVNIQLQPHCGAVHTIDNRNVFAWLWIFGWYVEVDRNVGLCLEEVAQAANRVKRWPTVIATYYPGVDEIGHRFGPDSPEYGSALGNIDRVVGRVCDALDATGLGGSTYYALITDHSMSPIGRTTRIDLLRWLRQARGLRLLSGPLTQASYTHRYALLQNYDAVGAVDAGRVLLLHLRGQRGWSFRPDPQEVDQWVMAEPALPLLPAIGCVMMRDGPDRIRVRVRNQSAIVERRIEGGTARYRIAAEGNDLFGYRAMPPLAAFADVGWHTSRQWLEATIGTAYPDFVPQVVEMFDSPRTGDIVLMAAQGWSFVTHEQGGHGSCLARDMLVPMFFAGPDLPQGGTIPLARFVDVMPTVLGLLGEQHRLDQIAPIDGVNLADELRQARPAH